MRSLLLASFFIGAFFFIKPLAEKRSAAISPAAKKIITGADQTAAYLPYLKGKRVAILGNQTSIIGNKHMVDSLKSLGVQIVKVFGPEHGFRGKASAGVKVQDAIDSATGIPVISLYGPKNKPTREDLADVDIMIYDAQDVGCRFYTNINALARLMEACAENNKELLILDRPNPNAYFIDGPILDMSLKSGIGMFPIPITHGVTVGEFAKMLNGEGWLQNKVKCKIKIIPVANYDHSMYYELPVKPSPNLNTQQSIMLYPSTCLFEGTVLNHGRGTYFPFTILGSPELKGKYDFSFTPVSIRGMSETPLHMNQVCYGLDLRNYDIEELIKKKQINLQWMIDLYNAYPNKEKFFDQSMSKEINSINKLIGTTQFKEQIAAGKTEAEIRKTWEPGLAAYKLMRKKIPVVSINMVHRYFIVNKPYNMVSQFVSTHAVRLLGHLDFDFPAATHAIGRLDNHSEGLLLLTTDKTITRLLFESSKPHKRSYMVQVNNELTQQHLQQLRNGLHIRTGTHTTHTTTPCDVQVVTAPEDIYPYPSPITIYPPYTWLMMTLTEGKYHQVRKMLGAVHHRCKRLIRVSIENMLLQDVPPGHVQEMDRETFFSRLNLQAAAPLS